MTKEPISLFDLRSAAACLLSLAVKQRFPSALLAGGKTTPLGFYYDFSFQEPFDPSCLSQIEEVMQAWIRQKMKMQIREMVSVSAREYFHFHREPLLVKFIEDSSSPTFSLAQIVGVMTISESSQPLENLGEIGAFSLQKSEQIGSKIRIYGTAFFNKQELKEFLKNSAKWAHSSHIAVGKKLGLFEEEEEGEFLWFPKGQQVRAALKKKFEIEEKKQGFVRVSSNPLCEDFYSDAFFLSHQKIFERQSEIKPIKLSECATFCPSEGNDPSAGLVDSSLFQGIRSHVFCQKKDLLDELISSLHFMTKIFKILDFAFRPIFFEVRRGKFKEFSALLSKALTSLDEEIKVETSTASDGVPRIEWSVDDGLGRSFPIAYIGAISPLQEGDFEGFATSICLSFERVLALILEKYQEVPFWLSPVQVKVVSLQKKHQALAKETFISLKGEEFRVELSLEDEELKTTLRQALEEGIPYVVVIGDKELETATVTLRDVRAKKAQSLHLQELIEMLKKVN